MSNTIQVTIRRKVMEIKRGRKVRYILVDTDSRIGGVRC